MPNYSFSTKPRRKIDTEAVERVKQHCEEHGLSFSAIVVALLKTWEAENVSKVQSN